MSKINMENVDPEKIRAAGDALIDGDPSLMDQLNEDEIAWIYAADKYVNGGKDE